MIEIGGKPMPWHILKLYSAHGINEFVICCGCKGYLIKEYFANYFLHMSDVTFDLTNDQMQVHCKHAEPWKVTLVDAGEDTMTGGRLRRVADYVRNEEAFCFTYGALQMAGEQVRGSTEKPRGDGGLINGGFFVLSLKVLPRVADDATPWEMAPLAGLVADGELMAFEHHGFWQPMDTLREKTLLEYLWLSGKAPWKIW